MENKIDTLEKMIDEMVNANMEVINRLNLVCLVLADDMKHGRTADNRGRFNHSMSHAVSVAK